MNLTLSRRNLLVLLSKLDRVREGGESACTIIKYPDGIHGVMVTAVEDEVAYANRAPGVMHTLDEERIASGSYE